jgi:hypothetical protein
MKRHLFILVIFILIGCSGFGQQSSFGVIFNGGFGFKGIPIFKDDFGNDVNLSTGGGFGAGVEYAYDFTRSFNLSIITLGQFSSLSQRGKNGDGRFSRMAILLTPALSLPARENTYFKLLLGAGPGLYSFGTMKVDATQLGGDKVTLKYKSALGVHASVLIQVRAYQNGFFEFGGKVYKVVYNYTEKGSTHVPTVENVKRPDGSGFDFTLGFFQKF